MFNVAFALTFFISTFFSPLEKVLPMAFAGLAAKPPLYQMHLLGVLVNYLVPVVGIVLILHALRAGRWLRPGRGITAVLVTGNLVYLLYPLSQIVASFVAGGAATPVARSLAPYILWPANTLLVIGLVWLAVRSIRLANNTPIAEGKKYARVKLLVMITVFGVLTGFLAWEFAFANDAYFRVEREAAARFPEYCKQAGEKILASPKKIRGLFLEPDWSERYNVANGIYNGSSAGTYGESFVNLRMIEFYEIRNAPFHPDGGLAQYRRYSLASKSGEPVQELASDYALLRKDLIAHDEVHRLKIHGFELMVKDLRSDEVIATLVYFDSVRHKKVCGLSGNGKIAVTDFIKKALNLKKQI